MNLWILLGIAVVLLILALRTEGFDATPSIKAPPYDAQETIRIFGMVPVADRGPLLAKAKASSGDTSKHEEIAGGYLAPTVADFFTQKFKPATTPITNAMVDSFVDTLGSSDFKETKRKVLKTYFVDQQGLARDSEYAAQVQADLGYTPGPQGPTGGPTGPTGGATGPTGPSGPTGTVSPICPAGSTFLRGKCISDAPAENFTCPSGYTPTAARNCRGQTNTDIVPPQCPSGKVFDNDRGGCIPEGPDPTCPSGYTIALMDGVFSCRAATTTTTTGGSTSSGATLTTPSSSNGIFGPAFTSFGDPSPNGNTADSSKFTSYPQLLGGQAEPTTTIEGVGVTSRGMYGWDDLPSLDSLGASEKSQYFPYSRTPGDMERIPDPFRVAQTFDMSSLSSKTEPVPFLTDFSAFQR